MGGDKAGEVLDALLDMQTMRKGPPLARRASDARASRNAETVKSAKYADDAIRQMQSAEDAQVARVRAVDGGRPGS